MKKIILALLLLNLLPSCLFAEIQAQTSEDLRVLRVLLAPVPNDDLKYYIRDDFLDVTDKNRSQTDSALKRARLMYPEETFEVSIFSPLSGEILPLLPFSPFRVIKADGRKSAARAEILDKIMFDILSTQTGGKICQEMTNGVTSQIMYRFGVSRGSALKLKSTTCPLAEGLRKLPRRDREVVDYLPPEWDLFSPYQFLLFKEDVKLSFESWTAISANEDFSSKTLSSMMGTTYIHLDPKVFTVANLYQILAHEIVMRYDYRNQLPPVDLVKKVVHPESFCQVFATVIHPQVRLSLSTARAFQIEKQILQELNLPLSNTLQEFHQLSCVDKIKTLLPYTSHYGPTYMKEEKIARSFLKQNGCTSKLEDTSLDGLEMALMSSVMTENSSKPICEILATGFFFNGDLTHQIAFQSFYNPGPRPPIGRGSGGDESSRMELTKPGSSTGLVTRPSVRALDEYNIYRSQPSRPMNESRSVYDGSYRRSIGDTTPASPRFKSRTQSDFSSSKKID